jgi:hypothetical protein
VRFWAVEALDRASVDRVRLAVVLPTVDPAAVPVRSAPRWFRALWSKGITAVAMPWAIYLDPARFGSTDAELGRLITHELTHIDQWRRLGATGWAQAYLGDYLRGRIHGLRHHAAYRDIGLEREARDVARRLAS